MNKVFTGPDTWTGGSIELLLLLSKQTPDFRILDALKVAWAWRSLTGPFLSNRVEPSDQERAAIQDLDPEQPQTLYGVAALPNGSSAAFACHVICDDDGTWIYLGSLGSLGKSYAIGAYPLEGSPTDPWAKEVYGWLAELAHWVFEQIKFSGGAIGWLAMAELDELLSGSIPERRYQGYLVVTESQLQYLPPNVNEPLWTVDR